MDIHYYALTDLYVTDNIWIPAGTPVDMEESPMVGFVTVIVTCDDKTLRVSTPSENIIAIEGTLELA